MIYHYYTGTMIILFDCTCIHAEPSGEEMLAVCRQIESMAAHAAQQQQTTQNSELTLTRRLRQAEAAHAAASEAASQAMSQAKISDVAASTARQALLKAQAALQETKIKLHAEQQKRMKLQVQHLFLISACLRFDALMVSACQQQLILHLAWRLSLGLPHRIQSRW